MDNFFKLHSEKIIGFKALTDAELGKSITSHQTHIGLFDDVLTFLPDQPIVEDAAMFIYNSQAYILSLNFDRIENKDGSFRSPKIRIGGRDIVSIVSTIRDIVRKADNSLTWYLFWFGLESEQPVFWLFNNMSQTYADVINLGLFLNENSKGRLIENDSIFNKILLYIESNLDKSTESVMRELEIEMQVPGRLITEQKIRKYDINRAQKLFTEIGKLGEEFVAEYFDKLKYDKHIKNYNWVNESSESCYPYDFYYQDLFDNIIYLDVKTTKFDFNQRIIYSNKEIDFAISLPSGCYNIFRVYNLTNNRADLRICKNCATHLKLINKNILTFQRDLGNINTNIQSVNVAFEPAISNLVFSSEIKLDKIS